VAISHRSNHRACSGPTEPFDYADSFNLDGMLTLKIQRIVIDSQTRIAKLYPIQKPLRCETPRTFRQ